MADVRIDTGVPAFYTNGGTGTVLIAGMLCCIFTDRICASRLNVRSFIILVIIGLAVDPYHKQYSEPRG